MIVAIKIKKELVSLLWTCGQSIEIALTWNSLYSIFRMYVIYLELQKFTAYSFRKVKKHKYLGLHHISETEYALTESEIDIRYPKSYIHVLQVFQSSSSQKKMLTFSQFDTFQPCLHVLFSYFTKRRYQIIPILLSKVRNRALRKKSLRTK